MTGPLSALVSGSYQSLAAFGLPDIAQDVLAYAAFAFHCLLIAGGGLAAVFSRHLVRALIGLIVSFLGVAGLYLLLACPFLAFMQVLIYVGAIGVLIFFAIMMVKNNLAGEEMNLPSLGQAVGALLAAAVPLFVLAPMIVTQAADLASVGRPAETPLAEIGAGLLSYYVVPFELISVILLVAMAGGVLLVWDGRFRK